MFQAAKDTTEICGGPAVAKGDTFQQRALPLYALAGDAALAFVKAVGGKTVLESVEVGDVCDGDGHISVVSSDRPRPASPAGRVVR